MRVVSRGGEERGPEEDRLVARSNRAILRTEGHLTEEFTSTQVSSKHSEGGMSLVSYLTSSNLVKISASQSPHLQNGDVKPLPQRGDVRVTRTETSKMPGRTVNTQYLLLDAKCRFKGKTKPLPGRAHSQRGKNRQQLICTAVGALREVLVGRWPSVQEGTTIWAWGRVTASGLGFEE